MNDIKINVTASAVSFWNALEIYYKHPNSINKQVLLQEYVFSADLHSSLNQRECRLLYERLITELSRGCSLHADVSDIRGCAVIKPEFINEIFTNTTGMYLIIRKLIPKLYKNDNVKFYEFIFLDKNNMKVYIFTGNTVTADTLHSNELKNQDPYVILKFDFIQLEWENDKVTLAYNKSLSEKGINWIKVTFTTKFGKLLVSDSSNKDKSKNVSKFTFENQVDVVEYYKLYEKLKEKYAKTLIEIWTETTDPKKFVHEDIGIAAYLILLWGGEKMSEKGGKKLKFVDLGCGNGLLVHILNSEGHQGIGLDIRKRKIWDTYPPTTVLKEETIIPTESTYPDADWLIGNHSDELTAWLPIMGRRSNRFCQYFVLPCCSYELNGKKFQRKNSGLSSYQDFILYVRSISELCQFETHVDKLRIPSTKRICLIGVNGSEMTEEQYGLINEKIVNFITRECQNCNDNNNAGGFTPRESTEPVRNCTKVPYSVREDILKTVMNKLLEEDLKYSVIKNGKIHYWNRGGRLSISSLAEFIDEELLKQLKSECKGLQTLLKNHHFLFEISKGCVQFRAPEKMLEICKNVVNTHEDSRWKRKNCWFFNNHPDGCPLSDDICSYTHMN